MNNKKKDILEYNLKKMGFKHGFLDFSTIDNLSHFKLSNHEFKELSNAFKDDYNFKKCNRQETDKLINAISELCDKFFSVTIEFEEKKIIKNDITHKLKFNYKLKIADILKEFLALRYPEFKHNLCLKDEDVFKYSHIHGFTGKLSNYKN